MFKRRNLFWVKIAYLWRLPNEAASRTFSPDFTLPSHLDKPVSLSDYRGKNVVIAFFPLAWTKV
jgi:hypothetical protein